jgi:hypothetical protein
MRPSSLLQRLIGFMLALALGVLAFTWTSGAADAISRRINELATNPFLPADTLPPGFRFSPGNLAPADRSAPKDGA